MVFFFYHVHLSDWLSYLLRVLCLPGTYSFHPSFNRVMRTLAALAQALWCLLGGLHGHLVQFCNQLLTSANAAREAVTSGSMTREVVVMIWGGTNGIGSKTPWQMQYFSGCALCSPVPVWKQLPARQRAGEFLLGRGSLMIFLLHLILEIQNRNPKTNCPAGHCHIFLGVSHAAYICPFSSA